MSAHIYPGPHELGQNILVDQRTLRRIVQLVPATSSPLVEWAAGDGAVTRHLARLGRPLEAVEIDPRAVRRLRRAVPHVAVMQGDILSHQPAAGAYDLVCNVPFHITTPVIRRLLSMPDWSRAVLLTQWEVARKRAGVGGTTLLTAQWWPWYEFTLDRRVPASAFRPRPSVDAGILVIDRRPDPLVVDRDAYQRWVKAVFNGSGRGVAGILARSGIPRQAARQWAMTEGLSATSLPRDLDAAQWASAFELSRSGRALPVP